MNDYIPKENTFLKRRENGLLLSDYQIEVLKRNEIDHLKYNSLTQILFEINDILETDSDEQLEQVAMELDQQNYYSSKKN